MSRATEKTNELKADEGRGPNGSERKMARLVGRSATSSSYCRIGCVILPLVPHSTAVSYSI